MYKRFFTTQRKFDNKVIRQLGIQKPSLTQKATALLTEIGEFSNEEGSVKYWKKRKKQNLQAALFEYIDMWKFAVSMANDVGVTANDVKRAKVIHYSTMQDQLMALSYLVTMVAQYPGKKQEHMVTVFGLLKGVQAHCSFTDKKVYDAWFLKHEENVKRLKEQVIAA